MRVLIRTSTSSMTSVPKPLKFLRPHYPDLQGLYEKFPGSVEDKVCCDQQLSGDQPLTTVCRACLPISFLSYP
jgi:hypothetical protein